MSDILVAASYAVLLWWASTGLALVAVGRSRERSRAALAGTILLLAGSLAVLAFTRDDAGALAPYLAFTAAIAAWGAAEIAFLTGWLTGPWRAPCPPTARGWLRAGYALSAILWHEVSLLVCGIAVAVATWGGSNTTGLCSFAILLVLRVSAKLNIFLGVPNITEGFLPSHLAHLKSFFGRGAMNWLFPVSVTASTGALVLLVQAAGAAEGAALSGLVLLATLLALGLLEHWFLVLPLRVEALWAWGTAATATSADRLARDVPPLQSLGTTVVRFEPLVGRPCTGPAMAAPASHLRPADMRSITIRTDQAGVSP